MMLISDPSNIEQNNQILNHLLPIQMTMYGPWQVYQ